jgi:hypothetical protein
MRLKVGGNDFVKLEYVAVLGCCFIFERDDTTSVPVADRILHALFSITQMSKLSAG